MAGVSGELHTSDTFGVGGVKPSQALTCCNFPYLQCEGGMERGWVGEVVSVKGGRGKWLTLILPSLAPEASISLSLLKQRLSTAASISIKLSCM